jgi:hypothetical protein
MEIMARAAMAAEAAVNAAESMGATPEQTGDLVADFVASESRNAVRSALKGRTPGRTPGRRVSWGNELRRVRDFDKLLETEDVSQRDSWGDTGGADVPAEHVHHEDEDHGDAPLGRTLLLGDHEVAEADSDDEPDEEEPQSGMVLIAGTGADHDRDGDDDDDDDDDDDETDDDEDDDVLADGPALLPMLAHAPEMHDGFDHDEEEDEEQEEEEEEEDDEGLDTVHEDEEEDEEDDGYGIVHRPSLLDPRDAILPTPRRRSSVGSRKARERPSVGRRSNGKRSAARSSLLKRSRVQQAREEAALAEAEMEEMAMAEAAAEEQLAASMRERFEEAAEEQEILQEMARRSASKRSRSASRLSAASQPEDVPSEEEDVDEGDEIEVALTAEQANSLAKWLQRLDGLDTVPMNTLHAVMRELAGKSTRLPKAQLIELARTTIQRHLESIAADAGVPLEAAIAAVTADDEDSQQEDDDDEEEEEEEEDGDEMPPISSCRTLDGVAVRDLRIRMKNLGLGYDKMRKAELLETLKAVFCYQGKYFDDEGVMQKSAKFKEWIAAQGGAPGNDDDGESEQEEEEESAVADTDKRHLEAAQRFFTSYTTADVRKFCKVYGVSYANGTKAVIVKKLVEVMAAKNILVLCVPELGGAATLADMNRDPSLTAFRGAAAGPGPAPAAAAAAAEAPQEKDFASMEEVEAWLDSLGVADLRTELTNRDIAVRGRPTAQTLRNRLMVLLEAESVVGGGAPAARKANGGVKAASSAAIAEVQRDVTVSTPNPLSDFESIGITSASEAEAIHSRVAEQVVELKSKTKAWMTTQLRKFGVTVTRTVLKPDVALLLAQHMTHASIVAGE